MAEEGIKAQDLPIVNSIENNSYLMAITDMTENNQVKNISKGDFMADIVSYDENNQLILGGDGRLLVVNSGQIQSDWEQTDNTQKDYIKNKPDLALKQDTSEKAQALGYAPLDEDAKVPIEYLPYLPETSVLTPFTANSGKVNSNGDSDIASASGGTMSFNVDLDNPLVATPANSQPTFTRTSIPDLDMSGYADGTYNVFVGSTGGAQAYTNTIFAQAAQPVPEAAFIQPTLSSNGTLGGSAFAVTCTNTPADAWKPFASQMYKSSANPGTIDFTAYNPIAFCLSSITIKGGVESYYYPSAFTLYASGDNSSWTNLGDYTNSDYNEKTIIITPHSGFYKYYKISITSFANYPGYPYLYVGKLVLNGTVVASNDNNVWLDTSTEPLKAYKYDGSVWDEYNKVRIAQATVVNGVITSVESISFNQNGYNVNMQSWGEPNVVHDTKNRPAVVTDTYINGNEWYRIWSDGWIEQGGYGSASVTLLKPYSNTNYNVQITSTYTGSGGFVMTCYDKTTSNFKIYSSWYSGGEANGYGFWRACGY